ncbi:MAG: dTDP-4-dehydrorhamnose reductase [Deltaproteobacteria bacterium]|nr:dTDP-4-dehydrorhamnose reductase [Deltaproteobacteria bacterium]
MATRRSIAIIGASGQLGSDLSLVCEERGHKTIRLNHTNIEVSNLNNVDNVLSASKPDIIINTAAFHNVNECENDLKKAFSINSIGASHVARVAKKINAKSIFISTDYVFAGEKDVRASYTEKEATHPINVYGISKLAGEGLVLMQDTNSLVVRVSSLFGEAGSKEKGGNFIDKILYKAQQEDPLSIVNDQWMTPTYTLDAAEAIIRLAEKNIKGVIHVTNPASCTWFDFASMALNLYGLSSKIKPISYSSFKSDVQRPHNSSLATNRLREILGEPLRHWENALKHYLQKKYY